MPPKPPGDPVLRARDERLDSLKLLAGQLAHDFNNFIAPILGYASLIKEEVVPNSQAMQYAMALDNSARKSERILENVLLAARPQRRFRPQTIDLSALLEKETQSWLGQLPGSAQIDLQIRLSACQLTADPTQWQNVFHQLLSNSRFALATGGRLDIALERLSLSAERAEALGLNSVDVCKMAFADHGLGMSPAVLDRAFDPFYSTRSKSLGVGLGLTIVHSVTRLHEGQVLLESQENEGTTVTIYLPMVSSLAEKRAGGSSPMTGWVDRSPPSIGKTVLVADDDPLVLEVVKACLLRSGYDVLVARDGREALEV
ncbi:MAG TPA: ATP-binding protein, partial [Candidatus Paceibacterota bacterium]|nr:ATP-binding protein [Candidatus Paceibacterota bacterium]